MGRLSRGPRYADKGLVTNRREAGEASTMSEQNQATVVDLDRLRESSGGDPALMAELVGLYLADCEAKLTRLVDAAAATELHQLGRVAHGIKGASAAMGCVQVARVCQQLEEMGRAGETAGLDDAICEAQAAWRAASEQLRGLAA